jgi:hypothetical protein
VALDIGSPCRSRRCQCDGERITTEHHEGDQPPDGPLKAVLTGGLTPAYLSRSVSRLRTVLPEALGSQPNLDILQILQKIRGRLVRWFVFVCVGLFLQLNSFLTRGLDEHVSRCFAGGGSHELLGMRRNRLHVDFAPTKCWQMGRLSRSCTRHWRNVIPKARFPLRLTISMMMSINFRGVPVEIRRQGNHQA